VLVVIVKPFYMNTRFSAMTFKKREIVEVRRGNKVRNIIHLSFLVK